jgi:opacity protein-like surface antigen
MKKLLLLPILAMTVFLVGPARAGQAVVPTEYKNVAPAPLPELYGTGFYLGVDAGANVYQDRGGDRVFTDDFGDTLTISPKNDVGAFGGIKAGYVFGTGVFRPTIEADLFYNGFRGGGNATLVDVVDGVTRSSSLTTWVNTGAFMSNGIMRFAFGRFQPYVGGGVGVYYAESAGAQLDTPFHSFSSSGGANHADFAWQIIAGADYYFTPKISTFIEYHYLDYTSSQIDTNESRDLGQHLIGAGLRFHF